MKVDVETGTAVPSAEVVHRVVRGGLLITLVAAGVQTAAHLTNAIALDYYWDALNADSDSGGPAWASTVLQFAAAVIVLLLAARFPVRQLTLIAVAAILAFLSLDDLMLIHERVSELDETLGLWDHAGRLVWPVVFFPMLAVVFLVLWRVAGWHRDLSRGLIRWGLLALLAAVAMEIAAQGLFALDVGRKDAPFLIEVTIEEGLELVGWGLISTGLAARLCQALLSVRGGVDEARETETLREALSLR